ncbi:alpha/beta hydrolase [bacterium]|nr:alpha/beta hydrolase [bacterium]
MNQLTDTNGDFIPLTSAADWEQRKAAILRAMQAVMGPLPGTEKKCPLDMKIEEEIDCGSYVRQLIRYSTEPDSRTPAYLCIPKKTLLQQQPTRAILCLHPTDKQAGPKVVVGLTEKKNRSYAAELAERGFVTLAPAYPLMANYQPDLKKLHYESGTMKAIWDNMRGLDLLASLPYVSPDGFGAIGHSLGGHNSVYTAVFDSRITVIVSSCGLDSYQDYMDGDITGWTSETYMPKLKDYELAEIPFDFHDLIGVLAPRHCFISAPFRDSNFKWRSVVRVVAAASRVYNLYDATENLTVAHPDCEHDFPIEMRERAYQLFEKHL